MECRVEQRERGHNLFGLIPWIQLTKLGASQQPHVYANFWFLSLLHRLTLQFNGTLSCQLEKDANTPLIAFLPVIPIPVISIT